MARFPFGPLADDMGLGKTIQALIALPEGQPVLVVGPAVAKNVWEQEAKKWRPDLKVTVLSGRNSFRFPEPGEMVIPNYDILSADPGVPNAGTVVVADEAHVLKSIKASRTKKFRTISEAVRKDNGKVWLMTATPLMNRPPELWSVLQAAGIAHEAFGSWSNFVRLFNAVEGEWGGYEWGSPSPEVPSLLQRVSLRRMKVDVLPDLPTKMYRDVVVDIELTPHQEGSGQAGFDAGDVHPLLLHQRGAHPDRDGGGGPRGGKGGLRGQVRPIRSVHRRR